MSKYPSLTSVALDVIQATAGDAVRLNPLAPLIGESGQIDSMKLVEICLALEDEAQALGFSFDWTSDAAMSASRSVFRTAESLAQEFARQAQVNGSGGATTKGLGG
jgi:acyl carrier protein